MTSEDAFSNLRNDAKLSNIVHAGGQFSISCVQKKFSQPVIILTATDGVFGYFLTPMHFEFVLLNTLMQASSVKDWETKLSERISRITGDDFALLCAIFGLDEFEKMQQYFSERYQTLRETYIRPCQDASVEEMQVLWEQYKNNYYRR
jgi:hypothetical protein